MLPWLLCLLLWLGPALVLSADEDWSHALDGARSQIDDIRKRLQGDVDDGDLAGFRDATLAAQTLAERAIAARTPQIADLDARLAGLGEAPARGGPAEAADVSAQRSALQKSRAALDAEIKRARLIEVESQQLSAQIADTRRGRFQARMGQRAPGLVSGVLWSELARGLPTDAMRVGALGDELAGGLARAFDAAHRIRVLLGIGLAIALLAGRRWVEPLLLRLAVARMPPGRLRRSTLALASVAITMLAAMLAAQVLRYGFGADGVLTETGAALLRSLTGALVFGAFVASLGRALLSARRPSWRLPTLDDDSANRLRRFPLLLGAMVVVGHLLDRVIAAADVSLPTTVVASGLLAIAYSLLIAAALVRLARARRRAESPSRRPLWGSLLVVGAWIGIFVAIVGVLSGYVAFATFVARQMVWWTVVIATLYLLVDFVDDVFDGLFASDAPLGARAQAALGLDPRTLDQFSVVLSGLARVALFALAIAAVIAPFGTPPSELLGQAGRLAGRLKIGELEIAPTGLIGAVLVAVFGFTAIRLLKRWMTEQFLPRTQLDPGLQISLTTLLGYGGGVLVIAFTLSALGLGVERIAWVASALSVGIGFGLQAIVQNFISGLILLAERPVKVGDWVVLGETEGDIRRINVRATEIQMGDRSTVIVPNSELITKRVRNLTLGGAEGRVQIRLPMPLATDAARLRELVLEAFAAHASILDTPSPSVMLEGIEGGSLQFVATAYVPSARQSYRVRSEVLFDLLARLAAAKLPLSTPQDVVVRGDPTRETAPAPRA